jgi:hypothetical protein
MLLNIRKTHPKNNKNIMRIVVYIQYKNIQSTIISIE